MYGAEDSSAQASVQTSPEEFIDFLAPSFLKYDYQGRVIRLDTFSKVRDLPLFSDIDAPYEVFPVLIMHADLRP